MKRSITFGILMIMLTLMFLSTVNALSVEPAIMPRPDGQFGQDQYYSVFFDAEGDAIVAAKIGIVNGGTEPLSEVTIEIPGESMRIVNIVEEVREKQRRCSYYEYDEDDKRVCAAWQEYYGYPSKYYNVLHTTETLSKSHKLTLTLGRNLSSQESANLLIYYKEKSYVDEKNGKFFFDFETIKMGVDVNNIRVAVNVPEDLYLEGGESSVDYRDDAVGITKMASADFEEGVSSESLQQFSNQINYARGYVKTTQGLDPWESFHVEGKYATSWANLNSGKIALGIILALGAFALLGLGVRKGLKYAIHTRRGSSLAPQITIASFISALSVIALWFVTWFLTRYMQQFLSYDLRALLGLLITLLAGILTLALLVAPSVYFGIKHKVTVGFITFGLTLVLLLVFAIVLIIFLAMVPAGVRPPMPYY